MVTNTARAPPVPKVVSSNPQCDKNWWSAQGHGASIRTEPSKRSRQSQICRDVATHRQLDPYL
jgi:hypothetical protein